MLARRQHISIAVHALQLGANDFRTDKTTNDPENSIYHSYNFTQMPKNNNS